MNSNIDFKQTTLGEVCDKIGSGATPRGGDKVYISSGIAQIRSQNVLDYSFSKQGLVYIDDESATALNNVTVQSNDILFNITGDSVARACIAPDWVLPARVNQHVAIIRANREKADNRYLLYTLQHKKDILLALSSSGATRNAITKGMLNNLPLLLPPLPEQRAIAATLSCLDDKIELNNRMNKTLEEMAQAIFKSWFVDFEPFQDGEFVDSELGRIPKGWRVGVLDECIELYDYKRVPLSSRERASMDKLYPYYGATSLMDYVNDFIFDGVYVLLGEDGSVVDSEGYPILQYVWGKFWVNNHAHILKGRNGYDEQSIYMLLKNTNVQSIVTGAVQLKINQANLKSVRVLIPDESTLKRFNMMVFDIFQLKRQLREESDLLVSARDILLPKLMSGEICASVLMEV